MNNLTHNPYQGKLLAFTFICLFFHSFSIFAQEAPTFLWDKVYGGENWEELNGLTTVPDGILLAGSTSSASLTSSPTNAWDMYLVKTDFSGNILGQYTYGGNQDERCWSILVLQNGDILLGGYSNSGISNDKTQPNQGDFDFWVIRLDKNFNKIWDKTFGGAGKDEIFALVETSSNQIILVGNSASDNDGHKTDPNKGNDDLWFVCIDADGNKIWDKSFGGDNREQVSSAIASPNGDYIIVAGGTQSTPNTGDVGPDAKRGGMDYLLLQMDANTGNIIWNRRYGGSQEDYAYSLHTAKDGGYYLGGTSLSNSLPSGPFNNGKLSENQGNRDFWLMKTDLEGNKINDCDLSFGGTGIDVLYNIHENSFGDLILGGVSDSQAGTGNKTSPNRGNHDYWLVCINDNGQTLWQTSIGSTNSDALTKIIQLQDGSLLIGGNSLSNAGYEKTHNPLGWNDFWLLRTYCDVSAQIVTIGDQTPCSYKPLTLDVTFDTCSQCTYQWSNGLTTPMIDVPAGTNDTFSVIVSNRNACIDFDTALVRISLPIPLELGLTDTFMYEYQSITIGAPFDYTYRYLWNTGDTTHLTVADMGGVYKVTVTNADGCTATDWIQVNIIRKDAVYIPNVFSPNIDGKNDYFSIFADQSVRRVIEHRVFDRWGGLVFQRDNYVPQDEYEGWDGTSRHKTVPVGNYIYAITVEYIDGKSERFYGVVTVVESGPP